MESEQFLGFKAKDKITGFKGMITGHVRYITGCDQVILTPNVDNAGKYIDSKWYDVNRIEIISTDQLIIAKDPKEKVGAGEPAPIK